MHDTLDIPAFLKQRARAWERILQYLSLDQLEELSKSPKAERALQRLAEDMARRVTEDGSEDIG